MLTTTVYFDKISHILSILVQDTKNKVRAGLFDQNKLLESVSARLLNSIYGYALVNLNIVDPNCPSIDLGDAGRRIAFQVTSTPDASKVQGTIDKFFKYKLDAQYDSLFILIIGTKEDKYKLNTGTLTFDAKKNVMDISDLCAKCRDLSPNQQQDVLCVLESETELSPKSRMSDQEVLKVYRSQFNRRGLKRLCQLKAVCGRWMEVSVNSSRF